MEKAGYKISDAPRTWDAFWDFFKPMQKRLRDRGMRGVYALGLQPTTAGPTDGNALFHHFLGAIADFLPAHYRSRRSAVAFLLAGRMAIPQELYEAAEVDGAAGLNRFVHITFPLLANLYLICTLLSTVFTLGDFNAVYFVSGGGPALSTHVLATLGIRNAFEIARPDLGMAAVMSALPLMIPLVVVLMRKLRATEVQL